MVYFSLYDQFFIGKKNYRFTSQRLETGKEMEKKRLV